MTHIEAGVVDVFVVDPGAELKILVLRRAVGTRCTGAWEVIHGRVELGERPEQAAVREVNEEVGIPLDRLYNFTCQPFYLHRLGTVQVSVVFVAFADSTLPLRLGSEHDMAEWLPIEEAASRLSWPRSRHVLRDAAALFAKGDAGPVEDVLRVF